MHSQLGNWRKQIPVNMTGNQNPSMRILDQGRLSQETFYWSQTRCSLSLIENLCKWQTFKMFARGNNWFYIFFFEMNFSVCCAGFAPFFLKPTDLFASYSSV